MIKIFVMMHMVKLIKMIDYGEDLCTKHVQKIQ